MTLSAPPEQTLREPLDRPVEPPSRRIARIAGIFKGFKPSPILYDDGPRAGVDGPLMPVLAAPDVAISLVAAS
jgi:hypothetical protein